MIAFLAQVPSSSEKFTWSGIDDNPEIRMNLSQMISYNGYPSEEYVILTEDGYYLPLNRIPFGRKLPDRGPKPAVLLLPGLLCSAPYWVANRANNSLGFILADAGYDVWLGTVRGTSWLQKKHQHFSYDQKEFWDFSFHEMGMYDLPAMINFILQKNGQKQLYYVGHSQGTTIGFVAFSTIPEVSRKIKMFIALSPLISIRHSQTVAIRLLNILPEALSKVMLGDKDLMFTRQPVRELITNLCSHVAFQKLCVYFIFSAGGYNPRNINMSQGGVYAANTATDTSIKNLLHWKQMAKAGQFQYFDYGKKNQEKYNQLTPPEYRIEDMIVPTVMCSGGKDLISSAEDVKTFLPRIRNLVYNEYFPDWTHLDFVWGLNAATRLYGKILELMGKGSVN